MEYTKNLKLSKPSYDDDIDIQVLNNNMDILDIRIANVRNYLPLAGGTMSGNIQVPYNVGLLYNANNYLNFYNTVFKNVWKDTVLLKGDRFKYHAPSGKELVVEDGGVYWNEKRLLTEDAIGDMDVIKESNLSYGTGYTKLNNGLLLQWGYFTPTASHNDDDGSGTSMSTAISYNVTLPLPFADTGYTVFTNRSNGTDTNMAYMANQDGCLTAQFTTTSFTCGAYPKKYNKYIQWFAIGKGVI